MWPYLFRYPGLVVLHDAHLHHARAWSLLRRKRHEAYRAEFEFNHPEAPPGAQMLEEDWKMPATQPAIMPTDDAMDAAEIVEKFLVASMVPDPETAALSPDGCGARSPRKRARRAGRRRRPLWAARRPRLRPESNRR